MIKYQLKKLRVDAAANFVLLQQADVNAVEKNLAHISTNTQILNKPKRLAFKWRWQAAGNVSKNIIQTKYLEFVFTYAANCKNPVDVCN